MDEWINYTHTHNEWNINGILFNCKTNEVLIHATTRVNVVSMLSKISHI